MVQRVMEVAYSIDFLNHDPSRLGEHQHFPADEQAPISAP